MRAVTLSAGIIRPSSFFAGAIDDIWTCSVSSTPPLFVLQ